MKIPVDLFVFLFFISKAKPEIPSRYFRKYSKNVLNTVSKFLC